MPISKRRKRRLLAARQRREKLKSRPPTNARDRETPGTSTASQEATSVPERGTGSDLPVCKKSRFGWSHLYSSLFQHVETAKDYIFPFRCIKRELVATQQRLQKVESELDQLKRQSKYKTERHTAIPSDAPPPLPPPLPPPPPPPPLPAVQSVKLVILPSRSQKLQEKGGDEKQPRITLEDIQNVRLKPARLTQTRQSSKRCDRLPVVTMSDLRGVTLRQVARKSKSPNKRKSKSPSPEVLRLRRSLRKVSMKRSPGGTPLISAASLDSGEGLTPLMTRALRQKFKNTRSPPLAPHPEECDCNQPV